MARGTTLVRLLDLLRSEARMSLNPAHNAQTRDQHVNLLQRIQEALWEDFTWPHLRVERYIKLQAGQRFYAPPQDMRIDRIEMIQVKYAGDYVDLKGGIDAAHYSSWDSEEDERSWPAERWKIYEDEQIEIWPVPSANGDDEGREGWLKLTGIRRLRPLGADSDVADLDDRLLALYGAAEILAAAGSRDAPLKLRAADRRLATVRDNLIVKRQRVLFIGEEQRGRELRGPPRVHYRTGS